MPTLQDIATIGSSTPNDAGNNIPMMAVNPMDLQTKVLQLRDLRLNTQILQNTAQKSNIDQSDMLATRDAIAQATTTDPTTGQPTTDLNGAVASLAQKSPTAAINLKLSMQQRQAEMLEKQAQLQATTLANQHAQVTLASSLAMGINSQEDLDRLRANAPSMGMDPNKIPSTYDPAQIEQFRNMGITAGEKLVNKIEVARLGLTAAKQTKDIQQMDATATGEVTGQYKDDPNTKEYINVANTYQTFRSMQATPEFSQGLKDRDLLYNFQNIINPNRSATGGTIEQDEEARSVLGSLGVDFNKVVNGGTLTPSQRQQIVAFTEGKFKDATMNQQVIFNNYQHRLVNMRAQGREVDPVNSLPEYGATVTNPDGGKDWVGVHNAMKNYPMNGGEGAPAQPVDTEGTSGIHLDGANPNGDGGIPPANASDLSPSATQPKGGSITPPPAPKAGGKGYLTSADITATAKASGKTEAAIKALAKAKGYTVE